MSLHLQEISAQVELEAVAVLIRDGASWYLPSTTLAVPDNIHLLTIPPYSLQLNTVETSGTICDRTGSEALYGTDTKALSRHVPTSGSGLQSVRTDHLNRHPVKDIKRACIRRTISYRTIH